MGQLTRYLLFNDQHASHPALKNESTTTILGSTALMMLLQLSTILTYSMKNGHHFRDRHSIHKGGKDEKTKQR